MLLVVINLLTSPGYFWAIWPILGWGVGLLFHALSVFGLFGIGSKAWEERKVREFVLTRQRGLNASQVRQLLHDELDEAAKAGPAEWRRVIERLENPEAIVTSKDWDVVSGYTVEVHPPEDVAPEQTAESSREEAARLARRVR